MSKGGGPLARQVFGLQALSLLVLVAVVFAVISWDSRTGAIDSARTRCVAVAEVVGLAPVVVAAAERRATDPALGAYAEGVRSRTGMDFVVVMGLDRVRYTHPDPARVGEMFIGDVGGAPSGDLFTQEFAGTLGPSVRAVVPVRAASGAVVGLVAVGVTLERLEGAAPTRLAWLAVLASSLLAAGAFGAWLIARRLDRQTHGLNELELARMYEYHDSMLHAVREGLLLLDQHGVVQLVNVEGRRLLGLPADAEGRPVTQLGLPPALAARLADRTLPPDELVVAVDRVLLVNQQRAQFGGRDTGSVVTLRDHTELQRATGELATVRGLTETLRAQNHEAQNRMHTVVSLIELGRVERAVEFATGQLASAQLLADRLAVPSGDDTVVTALLLGKSAQASERGIEFVVDEDSRLSGLPIPDGDAVTILGNLLDNAMDAVAGAPERVIEVLVEATGSTFRVEVEDSGPGVPPDRRAAVLEAGWTTKAEPAGHGLGLALVRQVVERHGGRLTCAGSGLGGASFVVVIGGDEA